VLAPVAELPCRLYQAEFLARGIASLEAARRCGRYVGVDEVVAKLQARLDTARRKQQRSKSAVRR